jgi:hypothetical protein
MKRSEVAAAAFLGAGFVYGTFLFLVLEPGMGFNGLSDFFDPAKVFPATRSPAWIVEGLVYLGFGVALTYLGLSADDRYQRTFGIVAGVFFFLLGCIGRVVGSLPDLIADPVSRDAALLGLLSTRLAVLRATVLALGVFAWRTTLQVEAGAGASMAWRGFGVLLLIGSASFLFVLLPLPPLFAVWAVWFAVRRARAA